MGASPGAKSATDAPVHDDSARPTRAGALLSRCNELPYLHDIRFPDAGQTRLYLTPVGLAP